MEYKEKTVLVPTGSISSFTEQIDKINQKAEKFGTDAIQYYVNPDIQLQSADYINDFGIQKKMYREVYSVDLKIPVIKIGDYVIRGTIEHMGNGAIVYAFGNDSDAIVKQFSNVSAKRCDHCGVKHDRRYQTILEDTENLLVVGNSCVHDFTGLEPQDYFRFTDFCKELDLFDEWEDGFKKAHFAHYEDIDKVLSVAIDVIDIHGYKKRDDIGSTADTVDAIIGKEKMNENNREKIENIKKWIISNNGVNGYFTNLNIVVEFELVDSARMGLVCSAVYSYNKHIEKTMQSENSGYIGEIKEKIEKSVKISNIKRIDTMYGYTWIITMIDDSGNVIVWFSSRYQEGIHIGDSVRVKGTIKGYKEFNGVKQTIVTRCKFLKK